MNECKICGRPAKRKYGNKVCGYHRERGINPKAKPVTVTLKKEYETRIAHSDTLDYSTARELADKEIENLSNNEQEMAGYNPETDWRKVVPSKFHSALPEESWAKIYAFPPEKAREYVESLVGNKIFWDSAENGSRFHKYSRSGFTECGIENSKVTSKINNVYEIPANTVECSVCFPDFSHKVYLYWFNKSLCSSPKLGHPLTEMDWHGYYRFTGNSLPSVRKCVLNEEDISIIKQEILFTALLALEDSKLAKKIFKFARKGHTLDDSIVQASKGFIPATFRSKASKKKKAKR